MRVDRPWTFASSSDVSTDFTFATKRLGIRLDPDNRVCRLVVLDSTPLDVAVQVYATLLTGYLAYVDGFAPIHGSCVSRDGHAVCIAGRSGAGKSTLAAALVARGARFVSDGVMVVDPESMLVRPGPPTRRLWDDALRWLGDDPEKYPTLEKGPPKRLCPVPEDLLVVEPPLLQRIFVVQDDETLSLEPLGPQESVMELVRHGFLSPWLELKDAPKLTMLAVALARREPVVRLRRPKRIDTLDETLALIDAEFR